MTLPEITLPKIELPFDIPVLLHPSIDHFAIVLPVIVLLLEFYNLFAKRKSIGVFSFILLVLTVLSFLVAYFTGVVDGKEAYDLLAPEGQEELKEHKLLGTYLLLATIGLLLFKLLAMTGKKLLKVLYFLVLLGFIVVTFEQGKDGGELVYEHGANVERVKILDDELFDAQDALDEEKSESKHTTIQNETVQKSDKLDNISQDVTTIKQVENESSEGNKELASPEAANGEEKKTIQVIQNNEEIKEKLMSVPSTNTNETNEMENTNKHTIKSKPVQKIEESNVVDEKESLEKIQNNENIKERSLSVPSMPINETEESSRANTLPTEENTFKNETKQVVEDKEVVKQVHEEIVLTPVPKHNQNMNSIETKETLSQPTIPKIPDVPKVAHESKKEETLTSQVKEIANKVTDGETYKESLDSIASEIEQFFK